MAHADDLGYTLDCEFITTDESEEDKKMSDIMLDIWASYANTG